MIPEKCSVARGVVPISPRQDTAGPMCRTVADAAVLALVMAERPLGFGAHGTDLEAFRLRGVRIGAMPLPKAALNDYLATLDASQVQVKTLADLIAFNRAHADEELIAFGQEIFELAEARGPLTDPGYRKAAAVLQRAADTEGLAALLAQRGVEVLLAPSNGPAELIDHVWGDRRGGGWSQIAGAAAIAGYPSLTVPAGLVSGLPVGITLVGNRNQDGLLLQVARAYERATNARVPPRLAI